MKCKDCGMNEAIGRYEVIFTHPETGEKEITSVRNYNQCQECRDKMYKRITQKRKFALDEVNE